jgi:hypothetical protein
MKGFVKIQAQVNQDTSHNTRKCNLLNYLSKDTIDLGRTCLAPQATARTGKIPIPTLM